MMLITAIILQGLISFATLMIAIAKEGNFLAKLIDVGVCAFILAVLISFL